MKQIKYKYYNERFTKDEFLRIEIMINGVFANNEKKITSNNNKIKKYLKQVWMKGYKMGLSINIKL